MQTFAIRAAIVAVLVFAPGCDRHHDVGAPSTKVERTPASPSVATAYRDHLDHVWVEDSGTVERILRDDTKRPRHQRFVLRCAGGGTILVAHNIDIAPRVPLKKGDAVTFRGEYIWNEQGGRVHRTHRDTNGGKDSGGWIRWRDGLYR